MAARKRPTQSSEASVVEAVFGGLGQLAKLVWQTFRGGSQAVDPKAAQTLQVGWNQVEQHLTVPATYALAVSEADKLFDLALKASGIRGQTLGERLKSSERRFSSDLYNQLWNAHKLRNRLAYEVGVLVTPNEVQVAVRVLQQGINQLGFSV